MSFYTQNFTPQEVVNAFLSKHKGNVANAFINCYECHKACLGNDYFPALELMRNKLTDADKKYISGYIRRDLLVQLGLT